MDCKVHSRESGSGGKGGGETEKSGTGQSRSEGAYVGRRKSGPGLQRDRDRTSLGEGTEGSIRRGDLFQCGEHEDVSHGFKKCCRSRKTGPGGRHQSSRRGGNKALRRDTIIRKASPQLRDKMGGGEGKKGRPRRAGKTMDTQGSLLELNTRREMEKGCRIDEECDLGLGRGERQQTTR